MENPLEIQEIQTESTKIFDQYFIYCHFLQPIDKYVFMFKIVKKINYLWKMSNKKIVAENCQANDEATTSLMSIIDIKTEILDDSDW